MEHDADVLEEIGFSKNEAKVFLALLDLGSTTIHDIYKRSKVHRTNVYDALEGLIKKGMVTYIVKDNKKYYSAADPENLTNILKEKEAHLLESLPRFKLAKNMSVSKDSAQILEGIAGIKATTNDILNSLKEGDVILTFGIPQDVSVKMKNFIPLYHKRRIEMKIRQKHIYNENAKERIEYLNSLPYTEAAYLPKEYDSPATTTIYGNKVAFWIWSDEPLTIIIESDRMAESYRKYFELLLKIAKKN
jgi:sugar-specific transcriptional regulator TrmB